MNKQREFGALLRRSSQSAADRALLLLYALLERANHHVVHADQQKDSNDDNDWGALSLSSLILILRFSFPGMPPRFLFALGDNGYLLRSPDRGVSWKRMLPRPPAQPLDTAPQSQDANAAPTLESITALLPTDDMAAADEAGDAAALGRGNRGAATSTTATRIRCLASSGDVLVGGGEDGLLVVSVNRGVTFQEFPHFFSAALQSVASEKSAVDHVQLMAELPSATTRLLLCAAAGQSVLVSRLDVSGVDHVTLDTPRVVLTSATPIVLLRCGGCASPLVSGHIIVSELGFLHLSWDNGATFCRVPHQLGYVRDVASTGCARFAELSRFPANSRLVKTITSSSDASAATRGQSSAEAGAFEYSSALSQPLASEAAVSGLRQSCLRNLRPSGVEDVFFTHFFVVGEGTDVLPYDYSCLLCVGVSIRDRTVTTFSVAESVSFVPYVRSSLSEPVCCLVQRHATGGGGSGGLTFTRGNSSGASFSRDGTTWTEPKKSAAVAVIAADGDALFVVGQRSLVTEFGPSATTSRAIPAALRVPTLRAAVSL